MEIITAILAFLIAILSLITLHEFGHFWVAKRLGVKVLRFSVGFGRPIWRRVGKDGTEYVIAWLPLGGYVRLLDEREGKVARKDLAYAFNRKSLLTRFLILLAGPLTNWLLGIFLFWIVFIIGIEQAKPIIGKVIPNSIAAEAGIHAGDEILKINNQTTQSWQKVLLALIYHVGQDDFLPVTVSNNNTVTTYQLNLATWEVNGLNPDVFKSLGITPYRPEVPPVIYKILPGSPAAQAGLKIGDRIISVNNLRSANWFDFADIVKDHPGEPITLIIQRDNQLQTIVVTTKTKLANNFKKIGFLGIEMQPVDLPANMKFEIRYPWWQAWKPAFHETVFFSEFNFLVLGKMILGQISLQGLGGPITIFTSANLAFKQGVAIFLSFLALLSITLAVINILPIPGLDGGHLLFLVIEAIRGRPLTLNAQLLLTRLGIIFLIVIMFQATVNDLLRMFS